MDQLETIKKITVKDTDWIAFQDELKGLEFTDAETSAMSTAFSCIRMTVTYGASRLLAVGSTTLAGRKQLIVRNLGDVAVRVSSTSSDAEIYESGILIPPGGVKSFSFIPPESGGDDVDLYVRSAGHACELEIMEVK